jgi:hypothetical protein
LLGGSGETLAALKHNLMAEFSSLIIARAIAPRFRPITAGEDQAISSPTRCSSLARRGSCC